MFKFVCWRLAGRTSGQQRADVLSLFLQTAVDDVVLALCPFQNRLLAGVGKKLRLYDIGKKNLLRKCETKVHL